ncbi:8337_t:CDS:1, partial [Rhizophagus irregularis]
VGRILLSLDKYQAISQNSGWHYRWLELLPTIECSTTSNFSKIDYDFNKW